MVKSKIFILQFFLVAFIAALHITALELALYWRFNWLDLVVHFLGGMWVALFSISLLYRFGFHTKGLPFKVLLSVLFVSIGWEIFEFSAGIPREANFIFDTSLDLLMDAVGGFAGFSVGRRLITDTKDVLYE